MITHGAIRPDFIRLRRITRKVECFEMLQMYFWRQYLREFLYTIPAILIAITAHEFAHGFVSSRLGTWFYYLAVVNIGLGTFNLIPLPPLDGSNVLQELFPGVKRFYFSFRRYAAPLLFLLLLAGILRVPLNWINNQILSGMWRSVVRILRIVIVPSGGGVVV